MLSAPLLDTSRMRFLMILATRIFVAKEYDVVVIGAGTGGYVAAIRAAQLGQRVAVVERQPALGGTCLLWGCIPTKALLEHAHAFKVIKGATEWGVMLPFGAPAMDMGQVQARKDKIVRGLAKGVEFLFKKNKVDWIKGSARLPARGACPSTDGVTRGTRGQRGHRRHGFGAAHHSRAWPSTARGSSRATRRFRLRAVPSSLVILGSGAVGVEFASIYRRFGSQVTIVELLPRLVPNEDAAVSAELEKSFKKQGIAVHTGTRVTGAAASAERRRRSRRSCPMGARRPHVGAAARRHRPQPRSPRAGRRGVGLTMDRGYIKVDELYRSSVPHVSAIGDVVTVGARAPHPQLAHVSSAEGILVAERLAGKDVKPMNFDHVPRCTYCDPEIGSVGLTEAEARSRGSTSGSARSPSACWGAPGWRASPRVSSRSSPSASTTRCWACT